MAKGFDRTRHKLSTAAVHGGEKPDPATGASSPNLVFSSTFVTDKPEGFSANELTDESPFVYARWQNPTVKGFEDKVAILEQSEAAVAFGSGMAAAAAIMLAELSAGDHLLLSEVSYAGIAELARDTLPRFGVSVTPVDTSDLQALQAALRPETKLVFIDTPANPILRLTDIAGAARLAHGVGARLAVDSTFATPIGTRPLSLGADYVMHSATKYLNGHGDAVGGVVCCSTERASMLRSEAIVHYGGVMAPMSAWLIARGMATLPIRMKAHQENAMAIAQALEAHPSVERVHYPGLPSHPQAELARAQMSNFSGMLNFRLKGGRAAGDAAALRFAEQAEIVHYAVSLGHHRTLVVWMPTDEILESSFRLTGEAAERYRSVAGDGVFRMSVGLEDPTDVIEDLTRLL